MRKIIRDTEHPKTRCEINEHEANNKPQEIHEKYEDEIMNQLKANNMKQSNMSAQLKTYSPPTLRWGGSQASRSGPRIPMIFPNDIISKDACASVSGDQAGPVPTDTLDDLSPSQARPNQYFRWPVLFLEALKRWQAQWIVTSGLSEFYVLLTRSLFLWIPFLLTFESLGRPSELPGGLRTSKYNDSHEELLRFVNINICYHKLVF